MEASCAICIMSLVQQGSWSNPSYPNNEANAVPFSHWSSWEGEALKHDF